MGAYKGRGMSNRRKLVIALGAGALIAPLACFAQQQRSKVARIGLLEPGSISANRREALIGGLREFGYVEGKNMIIEERRAEGKYERLPALAAELVQMKVDVIVASANAVRAAQQATSTIPIVMVTTADPVGSGFIASLARPGRNITGLSAIATDLSSKYLELLRAAVPKLSRVTVLVNPDHSIHPEFLKRIQATEKTNSVTISPVEASTASQIEPAFSAMKQERAGALILLPDPFFLAQARRIAELAAQQRLPTMFWTRDAVESGGLMSYGQNSAEHYYRAATYIDKILMGAKPGELPVEQPTKIELVINLKTAKAIGLAIPQELLLRADKVIE
ncbi:MAG: ABC transporter substrate-binding protein [Alphaproteobacteria bacterium]|nr:MAG: ABC transporter substrate-binding protein [Alphaproteobacteria bacterium]